MTSQFIGAIEALREHKKTTRPVGNWDDPKVKEWEEKRHWLTTAALNQAAIDFTNTISDIEARDSDYAGAFHYRNTIMGFANAHGWLIQYNS